MRMLGGSSPQIRAIFEVWTNPSLLKDKLLRGHKIIDLDLKIKPSLRAATLTFRDFNLLSQNI